MSPGHGYGDLAALPGVPLGTTEPLPRPGCREGGTTRPVQGLESLRVLGTSRPRAQPRRHRRSRSSRVLGAHGAPTPGRWRPPSCRPGPARLGSPLGRRTPAQLSSAPPRRPPPRCPGVPAHRGAAWEQLPSSPATERSRRRLQLPAASANQHGGRRRPTAAKPRRTLPAAFAHRCRPGLSSKRAPGNCSSIPPLVRTRAGSGPPRPGEQSPARTAGWRPAMVAPCWDWSGSGSSEAGERPVAPRA